MVLVKLVKIEILLGIGKGSQSRKSEDRNMDPKIVGPSLKTS